VNNLHIITLYKLHNKLSCESRLSRSSCRAVLFDKLDTAKMHGLDSTRRTYRDVTSQVEFGLYIGQWRQLHRPLLQLAVHGDRE